MDEGGMDVRSSRITHSWMKINQSKIKGVASSNSRGGRAYSIITLTPTMHAPQHPASTRQLLRYCRAKPAHLYDLYASPGLEQ